MTSQSRDAVVVSPAEDPSAALDQVVQRFASVIRRAAGRNGLAPEELDAVIQEVRIRLWKALETSENIQSAPASYVHRATLSAVVDFIRRRRARREEPLEAGALEPPAKHADEADAGTNAGEIERAIERALRSLPPARQAVVRLYLSGYDRFEISDLLGWTEAKTRNHLYRSLELMRTHLRRVGLDPGREV